MPRLAHVLSDAPLFTGYADSLFVVNLVFNPLRYMELYLYFRG